MKLEILFQPACPPGGLFRSPVSFPFFPAPKLSRAQGEEVQSVLQFHRATQTSRPGFFVVSLDPDTQLQLRAFGLQKGCIVTVHDFTPVVVRFLFDLLCAADWIMLLPPPYTQALAARPMTFRSSRWNRAGVPAAVCESAEQLGVRLRIETSEPKREPLEIVG